MSKEVVLTRIIHDPSLRGNRECRRFAARGPGARRSRAEAATRSVAVEASEGVPGGTSRRPRAASGCQALATRSVAAEGEGREDGVQSVPAAEGFMNSPG